MSRRDGLHRRFVFSRRVRVLSDHIVRLVPRGANVVDIGCGDGTLAATIASRRSDISVVGVDTLVRPTTRIPVQAFDGHRLPFDDSSFEVALLIDVLHHTDNPVELLCEACRVAPRAVIVKDHTLSGLCARTTLAAMDWVGNAHHDVALPYNYLTRTQWQAAFARAGLVVERQTDSLGLYPWPFSMIFDRGFHFVALLSARHIEREMS